MRKSTALMNREPTAKEMKALLAMSDPKKTVDLVVKSRRVAHRFLNELDRRFGIRAGYDGREVLAGMETSDVVDMLDKVARIHAQMTNSADKALARVDGREMLEKARVLQRQIERDYEDLRRLQAAMGKGDVIDVTPNGASEAGEGGEFGERAAAAEASDRQPADLGGSGPGTARRGDDWPGWD